MLANAIGRPVHCVTCLHSPAVVKIGSRVANVAGCLCHGLLDTVNTVMGFLCEIGGDFFCALSSFVDMAVLMRFRRHGEVPQKREIRIEIEMEAAHIVPPTFSLGTRHQGDGKWYANGI